MINLQVGKEVEGKGSPVTVKMQGNAGDILSELSCVTKRVLKTVAEESNTDIDTVLEAFTKGLKFLILKEKAEKIKNKEITDDNITDAMDLLFDMMDALR